MRNHSQAQKNMLNVQSVAAATATAPLVSRVKKSPVVLIAEGDHDKRRELKTLLDLFDVDVLEAQSGEEALNLTVCARPDLVLINTDLPCLDGFEAARLIRLIKSLNATPLIFLSSKTERAFKKKAFSVGGNGYFIEPLDLDRLDNILGNFLVISDQGI